MFCGRGESKSPAGSNKSKDWSPAEGRRLGRREPRRQPGAGSMSRVLRPMWIPIADHPMNLAVRVPAISGLVAPGAGTSPAMSHASHRWSSSQAAPKSLRDCAYTRDVPTTALLRTTDRRGRQIDRIYGMSSPCGARRTSACHSDPRSARAGHRAAQRRQAPALGSNTLECRRGSSVACLLRSVVL